MEIKTRKRASTIENNNEKKQRKRSNPKSQNSEVSIATDSDTYSESEDIDVTIQDTSQGLFFLIQKLKNIKDRFVTNPQFKKKKRLHWDLNLFPIIKFSTIINL